jgi:biotin operon repressor
MTMTTMMMMMMMMMMMLYLNTVSFVSGECECLQK